MGQALPITVVLSAVLVTAVTDVWKFKIYNALTLPLLITGLVYHGVVEGSVGLAGSLGGICFGFAVLFLPYLMGGMGAGDVKLLAAIGSWLGLPFTLYVFLASAIAAGVYAIALIVWQRNLRDTWINMKLIWLRLSAFSRHLGAEDSVEGQVRMAQRRQRMLPFGAMVALGLIATLVWQLVQ